MTSESVLEERIKQLKVFHAGPALDPIFPPLAGVGPATPLNSVNMYASPYAYNSPGYPQVNPTAPATALANPLLNPQLNPFLAGTGLFNPFAGQLLNGTNGNPATPFTGQNQAFHNPLLN